MYIAHLKESGLTFGQAMDMIRDSKNLAMRLPSWKEDVFIRVQHPTSKSKMTAPYFYVQSRFGMVPWKETMIELFSKEWCVIEFEVERNDTPTPTKKSTKSKTSTKKKTTSRRKFDLSDKNNK